MEHTTKPSLRELGRVRRRAAGVSADELVTTGFLGETEGLPLVVRPAAEGVSLPAWAASHRQFVESNLLKYGAILFRGFEPKGVAAFEQLIGALSDEPMAYTYRSTPRSHVSGNVYTSTEYPPHQPIPLHNEMSYSRGWPLRIWFHCLERAAAGGETPVADSRRVFARIGREVRERFVHKRVMYVRNYGHRLDLPWQNAFQTESREEVESFCRRASIEFEWREGDRLRTRQVCQAAAQHPSTGESVWFNQAHLFHVSALAPEVREKLLSEFGEEDLPRNAYYGDGAPIEPRALEEIREAYGRESVAFGWREGDVLMLDNMLAAHGREPFEGPRKVVVGMAEPFGDVRAEEVG